MSTLGLKSRIFDSAVYTGSRIPRPVRIVLAYFFGAVAFTALLLAGSLPPFDWYRIISVFIVVLASMGLAHFHLKSAELKLVGTGAREGILMLTSILALAGMQISSFAIATDGSRQAAAFITAAPLVALAMLLSGLLNPGTAIFGVTLITVGGIVAEMADAQMLAGVWVVAAIAAHAVNPLRHRNDLFRATYYTTAAFGLVAFSIALYQGQRFDLVLVAAGWGAVGGVGATALFWLAIAAFERAFGVVSDWSLLEAVSPDNPLMRELVIKAPGTYAHSVLVGNLSEAAASAIGANALLCRAMAYYHDIGKIKRPEFFIENKRSENPHDRLAPSLSAKLIGAHVKDGIELAEKHKLPKPIIDGIAQHHGTSLISYFYHMATRHSEVPDPILEQHFRYPGPRPLTKETAILMLADRVEAATRTLPRHTPGRLRTFIWEIVQDLRDDGQLDDSELNFRDLQTIVRSFVSTIGALNHERIEYPGSPHETSDYSRESDGEKAEYEADPEGIDRNVGI